MKEAFISARTKPSSCKQFNFRQINHVLYNLISFFIVLVFIVVFCVSYIELNHNYILWVWTGVCWDCWVSLRSRRIDLSQIFNQNQQALEGCFILVWGPRVSVVIQDPANRDRTQELRSRLCIYFFFCADTNIYIRISRKFPYEIFRSQKMIVDISPNLYTPQSLL